MQKPALALLLALLAAGVFVLRQQSRTQARWREDIAREQREHTALDRLRRDHESLAAALAPPDDLAARRDEQRQLEHELGGLRANLTAQQQRLAQLTRMNSALGPAKPLAPGMTPVDQLTNAGAATPTDAAQSFFWAVAQADPDAMARQIEFTDDARSKAQALFAQLSEAARAQFGSPERIMAIYLTSMYGRATGYQLMTAESGSHAADEGGWKATLQTASGSLHEVSFAVHRTTDGWHEVIGSGWVDEAARYLR
ncbi:MAG TPA: hypothetical protein VMF63_01020 [Opitutaceae bacterium]|nr:hypothetical protein [Opitutaceae bacterium]